MQTQILYLAGSLAGVAAICGLCVALFGRGVASLDATAAQARLAQDFAGFHPGQCAVAADARSAGAQGSIRAIALAQPWLEGGAVVAVAAWRKAEDAFAAAVGGGDESGDSEEEEVGGGGGGGEQTEKQPRASAASIATSPQQQQQQEQGQEVDQEQQRHLSFPTLEKAAGLAFGLSLLWLVLGVPPAALFGVFCVFVSHSLAREGMRFARLHAGGGWAGGRMRRVTRRIRRDRSRAALLLRQQKQQKQEAAGGGGGGGASAAAAAATAKEE